jgi:hypothetical protein
LQANVTQPLAIVVGLGRINFCHDSALTREIAASECGRIHRCLVSALDRVEGTFVGGPRKLCRAQSLKAQKTIYDSAFK